MSELAEERRTVATSIQEEDLRAVMFEDFGRRDAAPRMHMWRQLKGADIHRHSWANQRRPTWGRVLEALAFFLQARQTSK
jgi:hypothetical protein